MPKLSELWNTIEAHPTVDKPIAMKSIDTEWHGKLFRSRLEARWAVLFEVMSINWEYEPEGFEFEDGTRYLPDFLLHGITGRCDGDLYVEVKGRMDDEGYLKFRKFAFNRPVYLVGDIPYGVNTAPNDTNQWFADMEAVCYEWPYPYNFKTVDGDNFGAFLGIDRGGMPCLFGDDSNYLCAANDVLTSCAYRVASLCRFEHGERPELDPMYRVTELAILALRRASKSKGD